eukprot:955313-Karenia_brevis.AAC.1
MYRARTGREPNPDGGNINLLWMRQRATYEWLIPIVFPLAREAARRSKGKQKMIQHSFTPGVAQPKARSREAAAMRDTARMMNASSPGAPPGAVAHRRYPDVP